MRKEILKKLYAGYIGLTFTCQRANESVFLTGVNDHICSLFSKCSVCIQNIRKVKTEMKLTDTPEYPWQKMAMDYFEFNRIYYLAVVDHSLIENTRSCPIKIVIVGRGSNI